MATEEWTERWQTLSAEVLAELQAWRTAHPRATFREIEGVVEEQVNRVRARLLEEAALASPTQDWTAAPAAAPGCPDCRAPLGARGHQTRTLTVPGEQRVHLRRQYGVCPACGAGLFPPR